MSTLIVGDLHVDKLNHKIPQFTNLVLKTLSDTIDRGLERGIEEVILAGDIFDSSNPSQETMVAFLDCLANKDVMFYILLGNHDTSDINKHSLHIANWVGKRKDSNIRVILKPTGLNLSEDVRVWMLPHPYVEDLPKKYTFGIGHFAVNGAKSDNGFAVRTKHQPKGHWILGDFHAPQSGRAGGCHYKYVGSVSQLSFAEHTKKRVFLIDDGEISSLKIPLAYTLKRVTVSKTEDLPDVSDRSVYWQIKYASDFVFPRNWLMNNPNVVENAPIIQRKDKKATVLLENSEFKRNPTLQLEGFLRGRKYEDAVIERALVLAEKLRK